jgi:hypothetical protein
MVLFKRRNCVAFFCLNYRNKKNENVIVRPNSNKAKAAQGETMKATTFVCTSLLVFSSSSFAFLDSLDSSDKESANDLMGMASSAMSDSASSPLSDLLSSQFSVSPEQAATGSGALLSLAQSQLSSDNSSELMSLIPGLSEMGGVSSMLGSIENLDAVTSAFEAVGLDASMVSQFAPVILGYLTDQGASEGLLSSLGSLWQ